MSQRQAIDALIRPHPTGTGQRAHVVPRLKRRDVRALPGGSLLANGHKRDVWGRLRRR